MVPTNDFVPFCPTDTGSNLLSQGDYLADPQLPIGNQPGVGRSKLVNKAIRQATYIASCLAQFLANQTGDNILDDATQSEVLATMGKVWPGPTGAVTAFAGSSTPTGYLLADGTSYLRATYPKLFAVIGTTYGSVDGTHFNVPNLQGAFIRGAGSQVVGGVTYATTLGTVQADMFQGHYHNSNIGADISQNGSGNNAYNGANNIAAIFGPITDGVNGTPRTGAETRPVNVGMNYIIKT